MKRSLDIIELSPVQKSKRIRRLGNNASSEDASFSPKANGHVRNPKVQKPENALSELYLLTDADNLMIEGFAEDDGSEVERRPVKLTDFQFYTSDQNLITDLHEIEAILKRPQKSATKTVMLCGKVLPIYSDENCKEGNFVADITIIEQAWIFGFGENDQLACGVSSEYYDFYLLEPHISYRTYYLNYWKKCYTVKKTADFLIKNADEVDLTFEQLLDYLAASTDESEAIDAEMLLQHCRFAYCHLVNYDDARDEDEPSILQKPCVKRWLELAGFNASQEASSRTKEVSGHRRRRQQNAIFPKTHVKATVTSLVAKVLEGSHFDEVIKKPNHSADSSPKKQVKTGRRTVQKGKKLCFELYWRINKISSWNSDFMPIYILKVTYLTFSGRTLTIPSGDIVHEAVHLTEGVSLHRGDFVRVDSCIARILYFTAALKTVSAHCVFSVEKSKTILRDAVDSSEIILSTSCETVDLNDLEKLVNVVTVKLDETRWKSGESYIDHLEGSKKGALFFGGFHYDDVSCRLFYGNDDDSMSEWKSPEELCYCCRNKETRCWATFAHSANGILTESEISSVVYKGVKYDVGDGVLLNDDTFDLDYKVAAASNTTKENKQYDKELYPEKYRKFLKKKRPVVIPKPGRLCRILSLYSKQHYPLGKDIPVDTADVFMTVRKFYRPEDTTLGKEKSQTLDWNLIFYSNETVEVPWPSTIVKCAILSKEEVESIQPLSDYFLTGFNRFYYTQMFNSECATFESLPDAEVKRSAAMQRLENIMTSTEIPKIGTRLRSMDLFAGCGGISQGLHDAGISQTSWAIEIDANAAEAFRRNSPSTRVFCDDCNVLLEEALKGGKTSLPSRGEVDLIVGGPPCQGFSGMNRFNDRTYSKFRNSLIATFLSYVDFYRPRFVLMENVKDYMSFMGGAVFRLTLACLTRCGYQVQCGILQAGRFGVPQTRNRAIIMAAAPGELLPTFPLATHAFNMRGSFNLMKPYKDLLCKDELSYFSTPANGILSVYRSMTVFDGISDLVELCEDGVSYRSEPITHYQRLVRSECHRVHDHVVKPVSAINQARIDRIPKIPGADWRDLPNEEVLLCDGTTTALLRYNCGKNWASVCPCMSEMKENHQSSPKKVSNKLCVPQIGTIIPWCLPHSADRNNNWQGLYGRLDWDGYFSTTVANLDPMNKQGRILHPDENRLYSVREAARSQGFPDQFQFFGTIPQRYRQIGNAVPPPLAAALGRQILISVSISEQRKNLCNLNSLFTKLVHGRTVYTVS